MAAMLRFGTAAAALGVLLGCASGPTMGGVHARFGYSEEGGLVVRDVPDQGPAHEAGLVAGDRVMTIDGHDVSHMSEKEIIKLLRGPVGSSASIEVRRGVKLRSVTVERVPYAKKTYSEDDE